MRGAVLVAIAASIGNLLQGWDNATIAGKLVLVTIVFGLSDSNSQLVFKKKKRHDSAIHGWDTILFFI